MIYSRESVKSRYKSCRFLLALFLLNHVVMQISDCSWQAVNLNLCSYSHHISIFQVLAISAQIKSDKDSVEALVQPLENADRLFQEIASYQKQIEDLEYKLDFRGHGVKTMQEIQSELSSLQSTK